MLRLLCQLNLLGYQGAAELANARGLAARGAERLAWERERSPRGSAGAQRVLSDLYRANAGLLYARVVSAMLQAPATAEDVLADVFERAHGKLGRCRSRIAASIFGWRGGRANRALDMSDARRSSGSPPRIWRRLRTVATRSTERESRVRWQMKSEWSRTIQLLWRCSTRATASALRCGLGRATREHCAAALGVSVATFDVVLLRALRAFRKHCRSYPHESDELHTEEDDKQKPSCLAHARTRPSSAQQDR